MDTFLPYIMSRPKGVIALASRILSGHSERLYLVAALLLITVHLSAIPAIVDKTTIIIEYFRIMLRFFRFLLWVII